MIYINRQQPLTYLVGCYESFSTSCSYISNSVTTFSIDIILFLNIVNYVKYCRIKENVNIREFNSIF